MAQQLHGQQAHVSGDLHERIEESVKTAIGAYFTAGQLMAMPALIAQQDSGGHRHRPGPGGQPGVSLATGGFDAMCLTDPAIREMLRDSRVERDAIDTLWAFDPDKTRTLGIQAEIESALARRDIGYSTGHSQPVFDPLGQGVLVISSPMISPITATRGWPAPGPATADQRSARFSDRAGPHRSWP
jgi:hypothetical protein